MRRRRLQGPMAGVGDAGPGLAMRPFLLPPRRRPSRMSGRTWRHWFPLLVGFALLVLAPLFAHAQDADTVVVIWTAPGDDGLIGTASEYDLRVSQVPITAGNFEAATRVPGLPAPAVSGTRQRVTVRGLTRGTVYYFAIRTGDDAGNWSLISNLVRYDWTLDAAPPAAPSGLTAEREGDHVRVSWSANSEPDLNGYTVYRSLVAGGPYTALNSLPLTIPEYLDTAVPAGATAVWYQVTASDLTGNESARSMAVSLAFSVQLVQSAIEAAYPNPASGTSPMQIPVVIASGVSHAVVDVLDTGGRRVRRIELSDLAPGRQEVVWDGRNDAGRVVAPGAYRGWLIAGSQRSSIRLVRVP